MRRGVWSVVQLFPVLESALILKVENLHLTPIELQVSAKLFEIEGKMCWGLCVNSCFSFNYSVIKHASIQITYRLWISTIYQTRTKQLLRLRWPVKIVAVMDWQSIWTATLKIMVPFTFPYIRMFVQNNSLSMFSRILCNHIGRKAASRFFSVSNIPRLSLSVELPGYLLFSWSDVCRMPKLKPASDLEKPATISTKLPSGLTVVTRETYETVCNWVNNSFIGQLNRSICWFRKCRWGK